MIPALPPPGRDAERAQDTPRGGRARGGGGGVVVAVVGEVAVLDAVDVVAGGGAGVAGAVGGVAAFGGEFVAEERGGHHLGEESASGFRGW